VERGLAERDLARRVEEDDVGIRAGKQLAFAPQPEEACGCGAAQLDPARAADLPAAYAKGVHERQAGLDAGDAAGRAREISRAGLLLLIRVRAVVGRDDVEAATGDGPPERLLFHLAADGRLTQEAQRFGQRAQIRGVVQNQVVWAGLTESDLPARPRHAQGMNRFRA